MGRHKTFRYPDPEALLKNAEELDVSLPFQDSIPPLMHSANLAGKTVPNRVAGRPMEGCDGSSSGAPERLTFRGYDRDAADRISASPTPDGEPDFTEPLRPHQLLMNAGGVLRDCPTYRNAYAHITT